MGNDELGTRLTELEGKVDELEKGLWGVITNLQKNLEMLQTIHETFQNLNSYLIVNVGPPLFVDYEATSKGDVRDQAGK